MSKLDSIAGRILREVHRRSLEVCTRSMPPVYAVAARAAHEAELESGPRYSPTAWFSGPSPRERSLAYAAIAKLEAAGLVYVVRGAGDRVKHLQLTNAGEAAVADLLNTTTPTPAEPAVAVA